MRETIETSFFSLAIVAVFAVSGCDHEDYELHEPVSAGTERVAAEADLLAITAITDEAPGVAVADDVLFVSPVDDLLVSRAAFEKTGARVVPSFDSISADERNADVIYFHPDALRGTDSRRLRALFEQSSVLVAIDTPMSVMSSVLGKEFELEDTRPEYLAGDEYFAVSIVHLVQDPVAGMKDLWVYAERHPADELASIVRMIDDRLAEPRSANASQTCGNDANIDFHATHWDTGSGSFMMGWNGTRSDPDPVNGGTAYKAKADSFHFRNNGLPQTAHKLRARSSIWNDCGWVHEITYRSVEQSNASTVCDVRVQTSGRCAGAIFWSKSTHSIKPTAGSQWTVGSIDGIELIP